MKTYIILSHSVITYSEKKRGIQTKKDGFSTLMTLPHVYEYSLRNIHKVVSCMVKLLNTTLKVKKFETLAYSRISF